MGRKKSSMIHTFFLPFGPVVLEGKIGAFDLPHQWYLPLKVLSAPLELNITLAMLEWVEGDPIPNYRHTLENERCKLEGCHVSEEMFT